MGLLGALRWLVKMTGKNLDISSDGQPERPHPAGGSRPFVGIQFECCGVYSRIYVNRTKTAYEGYCPRCFMPVRILIGPGGTDRRFFRAY